MSPDIMRRLVLVTAVCCLAAPLGAHLGAQLPELLPGARVRLRAVGEGHRIDGALVSSTSDSLVVADGGRQYRIGTQSLETLELFRGRTARAGAAKGLRWGAAMTIPLMAAAYLFSDRSNDRGKNQLSATAVVTGAAVYTLLGAGIGALLRADEWTPVRLSSRAAARP